jgi:hypothetical protein
MTTRYATRPFIINATFVDHYVNDADALYDTREFFEGRGFIVDSIRIEYLERFGVAGHSPVPTVVVHLSK